MDSIFGFVGNGYVAQGCLAVGNAPLATFRTRTRSCAWDCPHYRVLLSSPHFCAHYRITDPVART